MSSDAIYGHDYPEPYDPGPEDNRTSTLGEATHVVSARMVGGGSFILDAPEHVPAVWGDGPSVLWAEGESLIIGGPPGVGKTTLSGQVLRGRLIGGEVLGHTVVSTSSRVLYLAMDRPRQIARALRRTLGDLPRDLLDERLRVWPGPPVTDVAAHPETLLGYARLAGADTIIVDSLKDAAIGLVNDEVGAGYNRARQLCIANGVEVLELHHLVKNGPGGGKPNNLAGLYGSAWITAGAGSVVLLWGQAGDPIVELTHLKTPADEVGPFRVIHDHTAGTSVVWHAADLLAMARATPSGITAKAAACALFSTSNPSPAEVEKARRKLTGLAKAGDLSHVEGDPKSSRPAVWTSPNPLTDPLTPGENAVTPHGRGNPSRSTLTDPLTDPLTGVTRPTPHVFPPLLIGGKREGDTPDGKTCSTCRTELNELRAPYYDTCTRCDVVIDAAPKAASKAPQSRSLLGANSKPSESSTASGSDPPRELRRVRDGADWPCPQST